VRARSTEALRKSLSSGRIPWESRVRRSGERAWLPLAQVAELADMAPREQAVSELRAVGVRGLVEELCNALDSSLSRGKLSAAAAAGLCAGLALLAMELAPLYLEARWNWLGRLGPALFFVVVLSVCTSLLTQMTYIELARLRPARRRELREGLFRNVSRLVLAQVVVGGFFVGLLALWRWLPAWLEPTALAEPTGWRSGLTSSLLAARLLIEVLGWPIFLMSLLLLGPLVVIEDYSVVRALGEWLRLVRQHLGRIYLYEALAFALGIILMLPLLVPIGLAAGHVLAGREFTQVEEATLSVLIGLALTPLFAYMQVANVFIYLNLRYEFYEHAREQVR
jgi:hypothetical protein